jgi:hypothetical protein
MEISPEHKTQIEEITAVWNAQRISSVTNQDLKTCLQYGFFKMVR